MAPGEGREFRVQTRPREVAAVKDRVQNPPQPPAEDKQGVRESGSEAQPTSAEVLGIKKICSRKEIPEGLEGTVIGCKFLNASWFMGSF